MAIEVTVQKLADAVRAATVDVDEQGRRIAVSLWELLAEGDPVTPAALAQRANVGESAINETVDGWPGIFRDDRGRVVGFWGLAIPEMAHRFHAEGGKPIHAWCALDPFLIVPAIGRSARVESKDPTTGEPITMTVNPEGVSDLSPASAVVSFLMPDKPFGQDVVQSFCNFVHYFATEESADQWVLGRDEIAILPVRDAFEVGRRAWMRFRAPSHQDR